MAWRAWVRIAIGLLLALAAIPPRPAAAEQVDLRLVLAADVSRSIDDGEFELQRQGYAAAFRDPRLLRAIKSGAIGRIAVCYVEWSGTTAQRMMVNWTVIGDEESAAYFAGAILAEPRPFAERTAIGAALQFSIAQFETSGHESQRRTIDVSGDGTNTNGIEPAVVRDLAVADGVTINGLVILSPEPMPWNPQHTHPPGGLDNYYRQNVAGGPGAFVVVIDDFNTFGYAMANKLIREIVDYRDIQRAEIAR